MPSQLAALKQATNSSQRGGQQKRMSTAQAGIALYGGVDTADAGGASH